MVQSLLAALVLVCCSFSSNAQVSTGAGQSGNILIIGNGWTGTVSACTHNVNCWAGNADQGDIHQGNDRNHGATYYWSGTQQTLANTIAINSALAAAGIQVDGFDYEWVYKNGNANHYSGQPGGGGVDPFEIVVNVYDANGNLFKSYTYDYGNNFSNWTTATGTELFNSLGLDPSWFGNVEVLVTGQDIAGQSGYWGPEFRADKSGLYVNYSTDPCYQNQTYDPACPGYANALFQQQCTANPLYDSSCPGYAAAFLIQQCNANPLYDPTCTGYAQAYYNQQCSLNPLYDSGCTGYQQAYLNQQCKIDPLYDKSCTGHLTAQCSIDPLYDPSCTGYASAYLADRCYYDPLYDIQCTGYQQAYFDQQCEMDSQYDQTCPTYLDPELVDLGDFDPVEEATAEPDIQVGVAELDFTQPTVEAPVVIEQSVVIETYTGESGTGFQEVDDNINLEQQAMEDDIETEIAELESQTEEDDVDNPFEKERDNSEQFEEEDKEVAETEIELNSRPDNDDGDAGTGEAVQEDDIEKEIAALKAEAKTNKKVVKTEPLTKNDKIRMLLAKKANELTKEMENLATLEQQMLVQRQLLALISFVPGFDYNDKDVLDLVNFYPDKPTVDHQFSRWFLNDPNFGAMEDLQYPNGFK